MHPTSTILYSELVLSLYPILIKTVNTNIFTQILSRFIAFPLLALVFGSSYDFSSIWCNPREAFIGILHNILNVSHIYASYESFKSLPVGTAISLFYLYPIFNIIAGAILFNEPITFISLFLIITAFIGTYLIAISHKTQTIENKHRYGVIMGIFAAISETIIFIFVRSSTNAQASPYYTVNHLYPAGLVALLIYAIFNKNIVDTNSLNWAKLLGFNAIFGFTGYIARFYSIPKVPTIIFSLLSFFGVAFGYLWGILLTGDKPAIKAIIGSVFIASSTALLRYVA